MVLKVFLHTQTLRRAYHHPRHSRIWPAADTAVIPVSRDIRKSTARAKKVTFSFVFLAGKPAVETVSKIPAQSVSAVTKTGQTKGFDSRTL
jgi:hypothetical protein